MKVISLFTGCGGFDYGFHDQKYNIVFANDILNDACKTYEKNFNSPISNQDILEIDQKKLPEADIIIGGPPCQGFSGVGKRDPNDKRSALVWKFLDIVYQSNPIIFIMENVTGIKNSRTPNGKLVISELEKEFKKLGYSIDIHELNSANYGVPQKRKRVFIVGNKLNLKINQPVQTHADDELLYKKWVTSKEALSDLPKPSDDGNCNYKCDPTCDFQKYLRSHSDKKVSLHFKPYSSEYEKSIIPHIKAGGNYMDIPDSISTKRILYFKKTGGRTTTYGRLHPKRPSYTLNTWFDRPNVGCNIHYSQDRMITIREGLRLQSFKDSFELVSRNKRNYYVQVGNAVPPLLGLAWAKHLKKIL